MEDNKPSNISTALNEEKETTQNLLKTDESQSTSIGSKELLDNPAPLDSTDESSPPPHFKCEHCQLDEIYDYFGRSPPWSTRTILLENAYIMKDPFSLPQKRQVLIIGAKCSMCERNVCMSPKCSLFFSKRFCKHCALKNITYFPTQVQLKVKKIFA